VSDGHDDIPDPEIDPDIDHERIIAELDDEAHDDGRGPTSLHAGVRGIKPAFIIAPIAVLAMVVVLALVLHPHSSAPTQTSGTTASRNDLHLSLPGDNGSVIPNPTVTQPPIATGPPGSIATPTPNPCPPQYAPQIVAGQLACVPATANVPSPPPISAPGAATSATSAPTATPLPPTRLAFTDDAQTRAQLGVSPAQPGQQPSAVAPMVTPTPQPPVQVANLQTAGASANDRYLASASKATGYRVPLTTDQLGIGTVIPYALETCVNSDLPGTWLGRTTAPIFDSRTHRHVVVPSGTALVGRYNDQLVSGQEGLLGIVTGFRFQDGEEFDLPSEITSNAQGTSGMYGHVNTHHHQVFHDAFLMTALGAASAALSPQTSVLGVPTIGQQVAGAAGAQITNLGSRLIGAQIARPPTITICPPYQGVVIVMHDLPLNRYRVDRNREHLAVEYRVPRIGSVAQLPTPVATPTPAPAQGGPIAIPTYPPERKR